MKPQHRSKLNYSKVGGVIVGVVRGVGGGIKTNTLSNVEICVDFHGNHIRRMAIGDSRSRTNTWIFTIAKINPLKLTI